MLAIGRTTRDGAVVWLDRRCGIDDVLDMEIPVHGTAVDLSLLLDIHIDIVERLSIRNRVEQDARLRRTEKLCVEAVRNVEGPTVELVCDDVREAALRLRRLCYWRGWEGGTVVVRLVIG